MIKKEERSEIITVPTNISTGPNSIPVPFSVMTQQTTSQLANSLTNQLSNQINLSNQLANQSTSQQLTGQQASVISMTWSPAASAVQSTPTAGNSVVGNTSVGLTTTINPQQLRTNQTNSTATMPINAIQNTNVIPSSGVHLPTAVQSTPAIQTTTQRNPVAVSSSTQIRPNLNIIQDSRSQTSTPIANHSIHHLNNAVSNLHHISNNQISTTSTSGFNLNQQAQLNSSNPALSVSNQSNSIAANQQNNSTHPPSVQHQQFQRLKVEDALSYLDQVKFKFSNQPQVYNDFLDIMKEFKSQSIDTPGVIQRVSNLFRGHPELIVGFNTFLPTGYKIEMQANDQVNVSMPNRTTSAIIISGPPNTSLPNNIQPHQPIHLTNLNSANSLNSNTNNLNCTRQPINFSTTGNHHIIHSSISNVPQNQLRNSATNLMDAHQAVNSLNTATNGPHHQPNNNQASQPVEFNHAINYVNKIKSRFQGQPDVYKQFLEILHAYQKEQKSIKDGKQPDSKPLTESEVYLKVAKLFQNQEDLLQEFGQFLPESNSNSVGSGMFGQTSMGNLQNPSISTVHSAAQHVDGLISRTTNDHHGTIVKRPIIRNTNNLTMSNQSSNVSSLHSKRGLVNATGNFNQSNVHLSSKKPKMTSLKDVTFAEASKLASLNEYSFFDKVRKALKNQEVYDNFLRFLVLYNHEILSKSELLSIMTNFLGKWPELLKWFKDFLGHKNTDNIMLSNNNQYSSQYNNYSSNSNVNNFFDGLPNRVVGIRERERDRMNSDVGMENIDYNSCKRYGASYRALPKNYQQPKCSGRTPLCKEVLNDIWVSFPSWSEDSTFVTSRKTQYEEYIYRCEDERFELDVVIETNLTAIRVFEALQKKLNRMTPEERNKYKLDDTLGGSSVVIIQRAIKRIYGDKAPEIVEGLKKSPAVAVPLVYRRLRAKEEEWREAQKQFNKIWREQNEKYYLKSLDHQSITFKQNDIKYLRSKSLINEIETIFDEKHEQNEENPEAALGPHMIFVYKNKLIIEEACNLIIHHVKRQTSVHKSDKQKIKQLLKHFIPDLFGIPRGELSDDEQETDQDEQPPNNGNSKDKEKDSNNKPVKNNFSIKDSKNNSPNTNLNSNLLGQLAKTSATTETTCMTTTNNSDNITENNTETNNFLSTNQKSTASSMINSSPMLNSSPDDVYSLFIVNPSWYLFFRLHYILCDRLSKMYERALKIAEEESKEKLFRKDSPAVALRLKHKTEYEIQDYFTGLIDMVKQLLDGNLDSNQFEDQLREMFGIHAYISFTLDKVVQNLVRQLQHIVGEESSVQTTKLFIEASKMNATGGPCSTAHLRAGQEYNYQKKAESLLNDENIFKILIFKDEGKLTIELLDSESTDSEDESSVPTIKWTDYINKYAKENTELSESLKQKLTRPLFLLRNIKVIKESDNRDLNILDKEENIEKATKSVEISDNTECKFDVNSFKAVFLTNTDSYLYRRNSFKKTKLCNKRVIERCKQKFDKFKQEFAKKNVSKEQIASFNDWLKGKCYEKSQTVDEKSLDSNDNLNKNSDNNMKTETVNEKKEEVPLVSLST